MFCIPSDINNSKGVGTNALIKKGAKLVQCPEDILKVYGVKNIQNVSIEKIECKEKIQIDINKIPEEYRKIYLILYEPLSINEISIKTKMDVTEIYSILFLMELEGYIKKYENKYVIKGEIK